MQKTKCYLAALVSGVLLVTGILAGCGQSKKDDHLTVYLWENRLMKNIAPYIHEQFPDQRSTVSRFMNSLKNILQRLMRIFM